MQFGNPIFLVCLTTLIALVALNLFACLKVTLAAARWMQQERSPPGTVRRARSSMACSPPCSPRPAPRRSWARRSGFGVRPERGGGASDFSGPSASGLATPYVVLCWESELAEISSQAGRMDGKIQNRHGLPHARHRRLASEHRRQHLWQKCLWLGIFLVVLAFARGFW